jgi:hypothetical protein
MDDTSGSRGTATKAEIVMALVVVSAINAVSYHIARRAGLATPPDPFFRELILPESTKPWLKGEYLYGPLMFQFGIWLGLAISLLPASFQERWLLTTFRMTRLQLCFFIVYCLVILAVVYSQSSNALLRVGIGSNLH